MVNHLYRHSILLPVEDSVDNDVVLEVSGERKPYPHNLTRIHLEHAIYGK
jgi:hypothetical protein